MLRKMLSLGLASLALAVALHGAAQAKEVPQQTLRAQEPDRVMARPGTIRKEKLLGSWSLKGIEIAELYVEWTFKEDGTLVIAMGIFDPSETPFDKSRSYHYDLDGNNLRVRDLSGPFLPVVDGPFTCTIIRLTDHDLILEAPDGSRFEFQK